MLRKLLVIEAAALAEKLDLPSLEFRSMQSVFPAVTCTVQASFRTASVPAAHGMIANGLYHRALHRCMFWEQSADLVSGARIWEGFRRRGGRVGVLFWQQSLGERADIVLSPAPIHRHHGGMIQDCYARPQGLCRRICDKLGRKFKLRQYWGPLASAKVGDWIADATAAVMREEELAPELLLTYLPTLDYDFQRGGPKHHKSRKAVDRLTKQLGLLLEAADGNGYEVMVFGDYAIRETTSGDAGVLPNRALLGAGLMKARGVKEMLYPDFHTSRAFAMVDHEVAHVYVRDPADIEDTRAVLKKTPGVAEVLDRSAQAKLDLDHPNSGELVIVPEEGRWFAYPWWTEKREAPDYAGHVDIHNKPGFDPCELFFGWPPPSVSRDTARIRGSHGRVGAGREVVWAATFDLPEQPGSIVELASAVRDRLNET